MNKCLKIMLIGEHKDGFFHEVALKHARKLGLEGLVQQIVKDLVKIVVCGKKEDVDTFVDVLHKELDKYKFHDIEIEPFLKDKDYRGVFRVIE